jgi:hypothetical protein
MAMSAVCIIMFCIYVVTPATAYALQYNVNIQQINHNSSSKIELSCSDDTKAPCTGKINLIFDDHVIPILVSSLFIPGSAYFRFSIEGKDLLVESQPYYYVAIDETAIRTSEVHLSFATETDREDSPNSILHRPVIRIPYTLATLRIEIHPRR